MRGEFSSGQLQLLSAALRHRRDARALLDVRSVRSLDQAFHLAGFGPECARKALLAERMFDKVLGHRFDAGSEDVLDAALALEPLALRYAPRDWQTREPALAAWSEQSRYDETGTHDKAAVESLVTVAERIVGDLVFGLFCDGRVPASFAW